jgi:ribonuclease HII
MDKIFFHLTKILSRKKIKANSWFVEKNLLKKYKDLIAIDEAGRGALAGPLSIGCFYLDKTSLKILEKNKIYFFDSKVLKPKEREFFKKIIKKLNIPHKVILINNKKIDKIGIQKAFIYGAKKLIDYFQPEAIIFDGKEIKSLKQKNFYFFIKGDKKLSSLGAASILAKTKRDKFMINLDKKLPQYLFSLHKGYGTKKHLILLKKYGLSEYHRKSFCKNL